MAQIFWVDEEENVAYPDILALRYIGHTVSFQVSAGGAVDWFITQRNVIEDYAAFVVDIQLPVYGDERFIKSNDSPGNFAGLQVCELVRENLGPVVWDKIRARVVLYTQLPGTARTNLIEAFARENSLHFFRKNSTTTMIRELVERKLIPDPESHPTASRS